MGDLVKKRGMTVVRRTENQPTAADTDVYLGDTMGELTLLYAASDVAFVAGSLMPIGGHNLLEPAALGLPVVAGPHNFNAQDIADMFIDTGACKIVEDAPSLAVAVGDLLADETRARELGEVGRQILERNRGALARLLAMLKPLLD